ncbi:peptidylprolyl isomerase [Hydrogenophaga crassostreae]|uniref:Peptidyl-prolyl cis-trans isomerase n=1 Tax=Hydrogenophaga crassostreae TaxID=1763535 RepID=A0A162ST90_9BURK|nr:peptidylprolyl isomerase [Hydrogenophaga crassostreae]AOW12941.1 peptidylprolyl isomerase [Hydrogenophaga crassostreae]OAD40124.1 peptidylprolyl isomerase [Hydrogenophaga crassostreae]
MPKTLAKQAPIGSLVRRHLGAVLLAGLTACALPFAAQAADSATQPRVRLTTSMGDIVLELDATKAPKSVENFVQYVQDKHYDGTVFHRVINNFMIQGGGFDADMKQKATRGPIPLEASNGLKNNKGTVAMARTANPNSATAQFFINVVDNDALNAPSPDGHGYAVFGKVVDGMGVVDKIKTVPVANKGMNQNVPMQPVTILKATLEK